MRGDAGAFNLSDELFAIRPIGVTGWNRNRLFGCLLAFPLWRIQILERLNSRRASTSIGDFPSDVSEDGSIVKDTFVMNLNSIAFLYAQHKISVQTYQGGILSVSTAQE